jgi:hypothetical protein
MSTGPERQANFLEVGLGQIGENVGVDFVGEEGRFVLAEAETLEPLANIHARAPVGLTG